MKKMYVSYSLLALALIACVPSYAAQAAKEQHEESRLAKAKHAAKKQVNESIERLKRCIKGNCSRMEALKAARDVTIAVLALYVGGKTTQMARRKAIKILPKSMRRPVRTLTQPIVLAEEIAMMPVKMGSELIGYVASPTLNEIYTNRAGKSVIVYNVDITPHSGETIITTVHYPSRTHLKLYTLFEWYTQGFRKKQN